MLASQKPATNTHLRTRALLISSRAATAYILVKCGLANGQATHIKLKIRIYDIRLYDTGAGSCQAQPGGSCHELLLLILLLLMFLHGYGRKVWRSRTWRDLSTGPGEATHILHLSVARLDRASAMSVCAYCVQLVEAATRVVPRCGHAQHFFCLAEAFGHSTARASGMTCAVCRDEFGDIFEFAAARVVEDSRELFIMAAFFVQAGGSRDRGTDAAGAPQAPTTGAPQAPTGTVVEAEPAIALEVSDESDYDRGVPEVVPEVPEMPEAAPATWVEVSEVHEMDEDGDDDDMDILLGIAGRESDDDAELDRLFEISRAV